MQPEPSQTVIDPNSLGETLLQPAPSQTDINLDSLRETSVQPASHHLHKLLSTQNR